MFLGECLWRRLFHGIYLHSVGWLSRRVAGRAVVFSSVCLSVCLSVSYRYHGENDPNVIVVRLGIDGSSSAIVLLNFGPKSWGNWT